MLEIQDVYYQPSSDYNLISCSQIEDAGYDIMFWQRQIMRQDQAIGSGLTHKKPKDLSEREREECGRGEGEGVYV